MTELYSLKGKIVLVTGAATGIGKACASKLAAVGASVMLSDIDMKTCQITANELIAKGYSVASVYHDVTKEADWPLAIDATIEAFGGLDCLVNNAGIYVGGTLISNTLDEVRKVHQVNIDSIFLGMKYAALAMKQDGTVGNGGSIINISSVAGLIGVPGHTAYGSTKGAVRLYTKHAAVEFGRLNYGIRVNSVHPGLITTAMGDQVFDDLVEVGMADDIEQAKEILNQMTPLGRIGTPEDIANMIVFLASDASTFCTGAEFVVDGGMSAC
jgi:NAD(P)-dependent dehydrogenase (short-subunit alcohol dehydrogenase family)